MLGVVFPFFWKHCNCVFFGVLSVGKVRKHGVETSRFWKNQDGELYICIIYIYIICTVIYVYTEFQTNNRL